MCIESPLLKYSAREHFFRASLCWLCLDIAAVERAINKYLEMFPALEDSRELKLLNVRRPIFYLKNNILCKEAFVKKTLQFFYVKF